METDLYIEEDWDVEFQDYVVIHPTNTWDSRTWDQKNWQLLCDSLLKLNIFIVSIGKNDKEESNPL